MKKYNICLDVGGTKVLGAIFNEKREIIYRLKKRSKSGESNTQSVENVIISVRHQEVTVTATSPLSLVRATTLDGKTAFVGNGTGTQCQFQLAKGVYIIQARSMGGTQRQLKVVVE